MGDLKLKMLNEECVLVEFVNEGNSLSVGYKCWLVDSDLRENAEKLAAAIEENIETKISWPAVDVTPVPKMQRTLEKKNLWLEDQLVRILGYGKWTELAAKLRKITSLAKKGVDVDEVEIESPVQEQNVESGRTKSGRTVMKNDRYYNSSYNQKEAPKTKKPKMTNGAIEKSQHPIVNNQTNIIEEPEKLVETEKRIEETKRKPVKKRENAKEIPQNASTENNKKRLKQTVDNKLESIVRVEVSKELKKASKHIPPPNTMPDHDASYWKKEFQDIKKKADQLEMDKLDLKIELQKLQEENSRLKRDIAGKKTRVNGIKEHLLVAREKIKDLMELYSSDEESEED